MRIPAALIPAVEKLIADYRKNRCFEPVKLEPFTGPWLPMRPEDWERIRYDPKTDQIRPAKTHP